METFRKWQNEVIGGFNQNIWLVFNFSKVGHGYSKMYVNSCFLVRLINDQGEAIGRLNQEIHNASKGINIMSTLMGCKGKYLHNMGGGGVPLFMTHLQ